MSPPPPSLVFACSGRSAESHALTVQKRSTSAVGSEAKASSVHVPQRSCASGKNHNMRGHSASGGAGRLSIRFQRTVASMAAIEAKA